MLNIKNKQTKKTTCKHSASYQVFRKGCNSTNYISHSATESDIGGHFVMSHKMNKSLVEDPQFQCLAHNAHPQAQSDAYNLSSNPPNGINWNQPK